MMSFASLIVQGERLGEANSVTEAMDVLVVNEAAADCEVVKFAGHTILELVLIVVKRPSSCSKEIRMLVGRQIS